MPLGGTTDPLIDLLKDQGYSVVLVPRTNLRPLQLLVREGDRYVRLGELADLFRSDLPPPLVIRDEPVAGIAGGRTRRIDLGVALTVLSNFLRTIGGGTLGLEAKYLRARFAGFEFREVLRDSIDILPLNRWLTRATVDAGSPHVLKLLENDRIYALLSVLKTDRLSMETSTAAGNGVEVSVPELQELVGGGVRVSAAADRRSQITFAGPAKLVFAFQALRLFYKNRQFTAFRVASPGAGTLRALTGGMLGEVSHRIPHPGRLFLELFHHPAHADSLDDATHYGEPGTPGHGPYLRLWLRVEDGLVSRRRRATTSSGISSPAARRTWRGATRWR